MLISGVSQHDISSAKFLSTFRTLFFNMLSSIRFYLKWFRSLFFVSNIGSFFVPSNVYIKIYAPKHVHETITLKHPERSTETTHIMNVMFATMFFGEKDKLDLNNQNHHLQQRWGSKRKLDQIPSTRVKRRITKYDNPKDSYTIRAVDEQNMSKFNTWSMRYKVTFHGLGIRSLPNILKSLKILFTSISKDITEYMNITILCVHQYSLQNWSS